jgi:hypothetical protein
MTETKLEREGRGTGIAAENLQEVLESCSNSGALGQSAFFTPIEFGKLCAKPLPKDRRTIVDLTGGNGALAIAASNGTTDCILLSDIEACRTSYPKDCPKPANVRIAGDLGGVFPLLKEIDFKADCVVLNPPWSLKWKKESFSKLAESDIETVRRCFTQSEGDTIDSTVMTLMAALDICSDRGEGFVIANDDTLQRLIFDSGAPFRLLENHIWARAVITGNPMTGEQKQTWDKEKDFLCGVIWFAQSHEQGLGRDAVKRCADMADFAKAVEELELGRHRLRAGVEISGKYNYQEGQDELWKGVRNEWEIRQGKRSVEYNIWLTPSGTISTYLSVFDSKNTVKIPKSEAKSLFELNGQKPISLVMARETRQILLHHCNGSIWRVDPKLKDAVEKALAEYYRVRAPLTPLNDIQRLGFCDESDEVECKLDVYEDDLIKKGVDISTSQMRRPRNLYW